MAKTNESNIQSTPWHTRLWNSLTQPHPSLTDVAQHHRARLLAGITLLLFVTSLLGLAATIPVSLGEGNLSDSYLMAGLGLVSFIGYRLSRTRYITAGAVLIIATLSVAGYANQLIGIGDSEFTVTVLSFAPLAFLIAVALLNMKGVIALTVFNTLFPVVLPLFVPSITWEDGGTIGGLLMTMGVLLLSVNVTRDAIERGRMAEMSAMNKELHSLSGSLDLRVRERMRDLALAAEVGRRISMERDPGRLLIQAADLIREHFDLYYTQIYLLDPSGRGLVMRAGTGEVGEELRRRGHRLSVDLSSANGTAVIERRPVIIADTRQSLVFRPHALLPDTRSEMVVPLLSGDRVLGSLDLQSSRPDDLSEENLTVFETLSGQLATALANAELNEQVQRTLASAEEHTRRIARDGWNEFLDAIETKERIGYAFDQDGVRPLADDALPAADACALDAPIRVAGEPVGAFRMVADQPLNPQDTGLVEAVVSQVARQIENLRLLEQAERYRRDMDLAVRRLTRQEWEEYEKSSTGAAALGFVYTGGEVVPAAEGQNGHKPAHKFDITVKDEPIGQFGISGRDGLSPDDFELVQAVTGQLGAHLENMRLYANVQEVLSETARQYNFTRAMTEARDLHEILAKVVDAANLPDVTRAFLYVYTDDEAGQVKDVQVRAAWSKEKAPAPFREGMHFDAREIRDIFAPMRTIEPRFIEDTGDDGRQRGIYSSLTLPLWMGSQFVGVISLQMPVQHHFTDEDKRPVASIAQQAAIAVRSRLLFEETLASEERFRSTSEQLSEALRVSRMGYWELDLASMTFTFTDEFYAMLRTTAEAEGGYQMPVDRYAAKFAYPDDVHLVAEETRKAIETTDPHYTSRVEHRIFYADGEMGYVSVMITVEKDEDGKTIRTRGANQDITDRKRAALALEGQQRTLRVILDNMPVAVLAKDARSYQFVMWNKTAESLFGIPGEAVIGKTDYDFYPKEQADAFRAADLEVLEKRGLVDIPEELADTSDGQTRTLHTVKVPVVNENNEPVLLLVVTEDITERKRNQEIITKRAAELATVAEISTRVATIQNPDEMLQTVVDLTRQSFDLYHAHIYLLNEAGNTLVLTRGAGDVGREMVQEGRQISMDAEKSLVGRAARIRSGVIVNDVRQDPEFLPHRLLPHTRSEMAVPMIAGDHLLGVMDVQDEMAGRFTAEDVNILTTLAAQVAVSLQNARSYARSQRQAEREALINSISERIQATSSVENALQVAVREIGRALGAQHTAIRLGLERKSEGQ